MTPVIEAVTDANVRIVLLNRPHARNALSVDLLRDLCATLAAAEEDSNVAAVVLSGADPAFCAGLDLEQLADPELDLLSLVHAPSTNPFGALSAMTCPVVAAVNGPAVTGGLELALNCDFIVASDRARFGDSHAKVGAVPGGGMTALLPQAVGLRLAKELSFTGRLMDAPEALRAGLVNHVVPHDELRNVATQLAQAIAGGDRRTVREIKRLYDAGSRVTVDDCHRLEAEAFAAWELSAGQMDARRGAILGGAKRQATEASRGVATS